MSEDRNKSEKIDEQLEDVAGGVPIGYQVRSAQPNETSAPGGDSGQTPHTPDSDIPDVPA